MTQNIEERAKINTFRSVSAMIAIGVINIITIPLISKLGNGSDQQGYLLVAILYGIILHYVIFSALPKQRRLSQSRKRRRFPLSCRLKQLHKTSPICLR